jgi:hypothetical protein
LVQRTLQGAKHERRNLWSRDATATAMDPRNVNSLDTFELTSSTTDDAAWVGQFFARRHPQMVQVPGVDHHATPITSEIVDLADQPRLPS